MTSKLTRSLLIRHRWSSFLGCSRRLRAGDNLDDRRLPSMLSLSVKHFLSFVERYFLHQKSLGFNLG